MNIWELWKLSKVVHNEVFFQGQIQAAGAHKSRIMQRYEKNIRGAKNFALISSIFISFLLLVTTLFPVTSIIYMTNTTLDKNNINSFIFATSTSYAIYFLINTLFIFVFGLFSMMSFTTGDSIKFLRFLPLSDTDVQQISFFTFIRMYYIELPVFFLALPVESLFLTRSYITFFALLISNFINILLVLYFLIITSRFLSVKFFKSAKITKINSIIKIAFAFAYMTVFFLFSFVTQYFIKFLTTFYTSKNLLGINFTLINTFLPIIFFPFTTGYIIAFSLLSLGEIPVSSLRITVIGFLILLVVTVIIIRKGNFILRSFLNENTQYSSNLQDNKQDTYFRLTRTGSQRAFVKENLKTAFREFNSLISLMFVFIIPILSILTNTSNIDGQSINPFILVYSYAKMIPFFLRNGLYTFEMNLGGILQSLPFKDRDFFRAKQYLMLGFAFVPIIITALLTIVQNYPFTTIFDGVIITFFLNFSLVTSYLVLYALFFGKINNRYTLFSINQENKTIKYILMFVIMMALYILELGSTIIITYFLLINVIVVIVLELFTRWLIK